MIDLRPLEKLPLRDPPPTLQHYANETGGKVYVGNFGKYIFIVTQDPDGHTEMSLSSRDRLSGKPPDDVFGTFMMQFHPQPISWMETPRPQTYVRHWVLRLRRELH